MKSLFRTAGVLGIAVLASAAWAAGAWVSVPSTVDTNGRIAIKGSTSYPLTNVTVRFAHAQASPIDMVAQAGADGSFVVTFQPLIVGGYTVTVFDSAGQRIGQGNFALMR